MIYEVTIRHLGGETRRVAISGFTDSRLFFTWPLCGLYEIKVSDGTIIGLKTWRVADMSAMREVWRALMEDRNARLLTNRYHRKEST